jgi:hypothetical protein
MIVFALGVAALLVNWLVAFPAAAAVVLHPVLAIFGIVFVVVGVAVITEDHIKEHRDYKNNVTGRHERRW